VTTQFVYSGNQVLEESIQGQVGKKRYLVGPGLDAVFASRTGATGDQDEYYLQDALTGSVIATVSSGPAPTVKTGYGYTPFGQVSKLSVDPAPSTGKVDILWRNASTGENALWLMNGTAQVATVSLGSLPTDWDLRGTGDFDSDGKTDILWRNTGTGADQGKNAIWLMNGTTLAAGVFTNSVTDLTWEMGGTGDFDGNNQTDILWRNYGLGTDSGNNILWLMNGTTYTGAAPLPAVPVSSNWEIVGTGDFVATPSATASSNNLTFTGREDDGTGVLYYRARYYSPRLQRFLSEDPLGFGGGDTNLYRYVGNTPQLASDPTGLQTVRDRLVPAQNLTAQRPPLAPSAQLRPQTPGTNLPGSTTQPNVTVPAGDTAFYLFAAPCDAFYFDPFYGNFCRDSLQMSITGTPPASTTSFNPQPAYPTDYCLDNYGFLGFCDGYFYWYYYITYYFSDVIIDTSANTPAGTYGLTVTGRALYEGWQVSASNTLSVYDASPPPPGSGAPTITSLSSNSGQAGDQLTATGTNLGNTTAVRFNTQVSTGQNVSQEAAFEAFADTRLDITFPPGVSGPSTVTVSNPNGSTNINVNVQTVQITNPYAQRGLEQALWQLYDQARPTFAVIVNTVAGLGDGASGGGSALARDALASMLQRFSYGCTKIARVSEPTFRVSFRNTL